MLHILPYSPDWRSDPVFCAMFAARKHVFVDLLKWQIPISENAYEIDRFDQRGAVYLVLTGPNGAHRASARLLPTTCPHLLDSLFADLCAASPPTGPQTLEITRFCLERGLRATERRRARDELVSALVDYALDHGLTTYTGVAEMGWFEQILTFGWRCHALGSPGTRDGQVLAALRIDISSDTPALLAETGMYIPSPQRREARHAA